MSNLLGMKLLLSGRGCVLTFAIVLGVLTGAIKAVGDCGCMDLVLVADDSGSMGGAISNIKRDLPGIISAAQAFAGSNLRLGLVTFPNVAGLTNDGVTVRQAFTTDTTLMNNAVQALTANGGAGEPESSDAALQYVIDGTTDTGCTISNTPLGSFRSGCTKVAAIFTDSHPGGCSDTFTPGVDDVHAAAVAADAATAGVRIASIYIPTFGVAPDIKAIMQNYASVTGGTFTQTASDGTGTSQGIKDIIVSLITSVTNSAATRSSRFWFTHAYNTSNCTCATLLKAIQINGGNLDLGFVNLPTANRNADNVIDANDALIEALGLYYKGNGKTGETGGTQNQKIKASSLCKARKDLGIELSAAIANTELLLANPADMTYVNGGATTNFPVDLIQQAQTVASGDDVTAIRSMTTLLKKFNSSGSTNDFPSGLVECSAQKKKDLQGIALDPSTQLNCGGAGTSCDSAEPVVFPNSSNPFTKAVFKRSQNLSTATNSVPSPTCNTGGADAVWQVKPTTVGTTGRQFSVYTDGSNFDTMISVWTGTCSSLVQVACIDNVIGVGGEQLSFTVDGTNTYRIVIEGPTGQIGKLKLKITSP